MGWNTSKRLLMATSPPVPSGASSAYRAFVLEVPCLHAGPWEFTSLGDLRCVQCHVPLGAIMGSGPTPETQNDTA
jgi:hypothetical protein